MGSHAYFLIDDDQDDREIFELAAQEANAKSRCITCSSGIEALRLLGSRSVMPTHIFIDINMPLMNGKECLLAIRKLQHLSAIPVFMYTTSSQVKDKDELIALGAYDIITKPSKISQLVALLQDISLNQ